MRRISALFYDALLLLAVLFLATALALPFNAIQAFSSDQFYYRLYLLAVSYFFYCWFWTHGGQTLGLKAWKIQVCNMHNRPITWQQASFRFFAAIISWACLGMGFFWCLLDKNRLCWHDHLSKTRLRLINGEKTNP